MSIQKTRPRILKRILKPNKNEATVFTHIIYLPTQPKKQYYVNKLKNSHCIYIILTMTVSNMRIQLNYYYFFVGMTGIFNKISENMRLLFRK